MERRRFEKLVQKAIEELPDEFRQRLENVAVIVEDRPTEEQLEELDIPPENTLFGLYEGTPLTDRGFEAPLHPDRIWIFQEAMEQGCPSDEEIKEEIKITIAHEVAHFFGLDDDYLHELGY